MRQKTRNLTDPCLKKDALLPSSSKPAFGLYQSDDRLQHVYGCKIMMLAAYLFKYGSSIPYRPREVKRKGKKICGEWAVKGQ